MDDAIALLFIVIAVGLVLMVGLLAALGLAVYAVAVLCYYLWTRWVRVRRTGNPQAAVNRFPQG